MPISNIPSTLNDPHGNFESSTSSSGASTLTQSLAHPRRNSEDDQAREDMLKVRSYILSEDLHRLSYSQMPLDEQTGKEHGLDSGDKKPEKCEDCGHNSAYYDVNKLVHLAEMYVSSS